jgi:Flp pilus assembly protein TadG
MFNKRINRPLGRTRTPALRLGSQLIELMFAIVVLLFLMLGMIEFGYYFFVKHSMQGAAREGCRAAIVPSADSTAVTKAVAASLNAAGLNGSSVTLDGKYTLLLSPDNWASMTSGGSITVEVDASWNSFGVRPLSQFRSDTGDKTIKAITIMRKE